MDTHYSLSTLHPCHALRHRRAPLSWARINRTFTCQMLLLAAMFLLFSQPHVASALLKADDVDNVDKLILADKDRESDEHSIHPVESEDPSEMKLVKGPTGKQVSDAGFIHAFVASISVIIVSELGDKTFFIAAIMAMKHPRLTVFAGAMSALTLMTVLSAFLGFATTIIPRKVTYYISSALFAIFGVKMLKDGYSMKAEAAQEEFNEAQEEVKKKEEELGKGRLDYSHPHFHFNVWPLTLLLKTSQQVDVEAGGVSAGQTGSVLSFISRVFLQSFTLTFLAEWGDRSQLATILLAARDNVVGVTLGGTLGHSLCTGFAVLGGRFIAQRISVRTVTLAGGVVFLIFAVSAFFIDPDPS